MDCETCQLHNKMTDRLWESVQKIDPNASRAYASYVAVIHKYLCRVMQAHGVGTIKNCSKIMDTVAWRLRGVETITSPRGIMAWILRNQVLIFEDNMQASRADIEEERGTDQTKVLDKLLEELAV